MSNFFDQIFYVTCMHLVGLVSPGPDFFVVAKNSMQHGRRLGFCTAVGIVSGLCLHLIYSILGLGLLIATSPALFNAIKYCGCAYLVYLGAKALIGSFRAPQASAASSCPSAKGGTGLQAAQAVKEGFLTNAFNPKCTVYLFSIFSSVASQQTSMTHQIWLGVIILLTTIAWFSLVSFGFSHTHTQTLFRRHEPTFQRVFGGVIIAMAIAIAGLA